jgi:carbonic anhydrase
MIDNWLSSIRALRRIHHLELDALPPEAAADRLCELNVLAQARHIAHTTIVEDAWERGQEIHIHSWIYRLDTGIITPLAPPIHQSIESLPAGTVPPAVDEFPDSA